MLTSYTSGASAIYQSDTAFYVAAGFDQSSAYAYAVRRSQNEIAAIQTALAALS